LVDRLMAQFPDLPNPEWIALRLLEGDLTVAAKVADGSIGQFVADHATTVRTTA
jgi:ferrous iron transport protein B